MTGRRTSLYVPADLVDAADAAKKAGRSLTDILRAGFAAEGFTEPPLTRADLAAELAPLIAAVQAAPKASRARQASPAPAERASGTRESSTAECPPHPPGRVHKGLCGACGRHVS